MVRTMNIWTDDTPEAQKARERLYLHSAIQGAEKNGALFPKKAYVVAGLIPPKKATDEFQQPSLWRRFINFWRPVW